jgi:hypothetical protein
METDLLLQVFKGAYEAENERYAQLESRAKFYLTVISFYLGAIAFKFADVLKFLEQYRISGGVYIGAGVLLSFSLLLTILATRIRGYEAAFDLDKISEECESSMPDEERFHIKCLASYRVATRRNRRTNDRVGKLLSASSWLLFGAALLQLIIFVTAFYLSATNR